MPSPRPRPRAIPLLSSSLPSTAGICSIEVATGGEGDAEGGGDGEAEGGGGEGEEEGGGIGGGGAGLLPQASSGAMMLVPEKKKLRP